MKLVHLALFAALAFAPIVHASERGDAPFVVTYVCDGGRYLAVGYPAYADRTPRFLPRLRR